nr:uncharacterized protein DKFZp434B061-like [Drosophila kikkawai]
MHTRSPEATTSSAVHTLPAAMSTRSPEATTSRAGRAPPAAVANRSPEGATPSAVPEPTAATTPPAMTPRSSPLSAALGMSPGTIGQLLDQIPAGVEDLIWAAPERWNPDGLVSPPQDATDGRERSPVRVSQDPPEGERYPLPDGWEHNLPDRRVPAVVWRTISARLAAAQYARQRLRVRTEDGSYQITLRPSGRGTVSFVPRKLAETRRVLDRRILVTAHVPIQNEKRPQPESSSVFRRNGTPPDRVPRHAPDRRPSAPRTPRPSGVVAPAFPPQPRFRYRESLRRPTYILGLQRHLLVRVPLTTNPRFRPTTPPRGVSCDLTIGVAPVRGRYSPSLGRSSFPPHPNFTSTVGSALTGSHQGAPATISLTSASLKPRSKSHPFARQVVWETHLLPAAIRMRQYSGSWH